VTTTPPSFPPPAASLRALEKMKVLRSRFPLGFLRELRNKEWWYTGIHDPPSGLYVSWYFVRVNVVDQLTMTVFDPRRGDGSLPRFQRYCLLDRDQPGAGLSLRGGGRDWKVSFQLVEEAAPDPGSWRFQLESAALSADVRIAPVTPPFTKFDNELRNHYAIVHYFQARATGRVSVAGGADHVLDGALAYQDHCWGRVPSRTGWHWIAVQGERIALTTLVNYGAYAQRYAQVWLADGDVGARREWIRLEQGVSFEREDRADLRGRWQITSTDLDLVLQPRQLVTDRTKIPPVLGLLVDLAHTEAAVTAEGRVRVDGRWIETGPMYGVMEQHGGRW
jgi:hypothetical protein